MRLVRCSPESKGPQGQCGPCSTLPCRPGKVHALQPALPIAFRQNRHNRIPLLKGGSTRGTVAGRTHMGIRASGGSHRRECSGPSPPLAAGDGKLPLRCPTRPHLEAHGLGTPRAPCHILARVRIAIHPQVRVRALEIHLQVRPVPGPAGSRGVNDVQPGTPRCSRMFRGRHAVDIGPRSPGNPPISTKTRKPPNFPVDAQACKH